MAVDTAGHVRHATTRSFVDGKVSPTRAFGLYGVGEGETVLVLDEVPVLLGVGVLDGVLLAVGVTLAVGVMDGVRVEDGVAVPVRVVVELEDDVPEGVPVGVADKEGVVLKLTQEAVRPVIAVITPLCNL